MAAICHYINYGSFLRQHSQSQVNKDNPTRILPQSPLLVCANGFVCINSGLGRYFNKPCGRSLNGDRDRGPSLMCSASTGSSAAVDGGNGDEIDSRTLIWRAIKLPIYSVALIPLMVGTAASYFQTGVYSSFRFWVLLASSVLIITWLNLSNDVYDFDTGADKNKKESVVNILGSRDGTLLAACLLLALGFMGIVWVSIDAANLRAMMLLSSAIICGYIYQCPPFRLSYQGLGEPLCFAAFGPFATTAFYLLQGTTGELPITVTVLSVSLLVGLTTSLILFCSHFHQVEEDKAVRKMSPLVRIGTKTGAEVVKAAIVSLYLSLLVFGLSRVLPSTSVILCALTIPIGKLVVNYVEENHEVRAFISCKFAYSITRGTRLPEYVGDRSDFPFPRTWINYFGTSVVG
ncbi:transferase [Lithospermum erythrorhizon]|uniref:Transferase n=1 Tax=Lithospermum erythrorhizon TaxID=34254 RepID=A0AAV3QV63_LITER